MGDELLTFSLCFDTVRPFVLARSWTPADLLLTALFLLLFELPRPHPLHPSDLRIQLLHAILLASGTLASSLARTSSALAPPSPLLHLE